VLASSKSSKQQLRLRVFAGPNGSGKSTIIKEVQNTVVDGKPIDFGYYINADDITQDLINGKFSFNKYMLTTNNERLIHFAGASGLINPDYPIEEFTKSYTIKGKAIVLLKSGSPDKVGQIIARFLREEMLRLKRRFSFETVFSHESNLEIMKRAAAEGYKVYLYFVTTESPEINVYRVQLRVRQGGHAVPPDTIRSRYYRSLKLLYDAAEIAYQSFFFDNSKDNKPFELVAHFKKQGDKKVWDKTDRSKLTNWLRKYYLERKL
jgi:predicted ABC-type ATPase